MTETAQMVPPGGHGWQPYPGAPMIVVERASRWFGDVVAVSDVSCAIGPGVTALLGPNGAGKSTLMRMLCGLTPPSQGSVRVLGLDPHRSTELYRRIGLVPQQEGLFDRLTGLGFVRLAADLHGIDSPGAAAEAALREVELDPADDRPCSTYSKGMRQRLKVAQAIVHDPQVLLLDEPLEGLDPRQRRHLIDLFTRLGAAGRCVIVSSHVLDEVERFGSRVLVLAQGRLAAEGDFHAIRELMDTRPHRIRLRSDRPRELAAALVASGSAAGVHLRGDGFIFADVLDVAAFRRAIAPTAADVGARLFELVPLDDDLESVFRYLVGPS